MAKEWIAVFHARGGAWNIDNARISELEDLAEDAETILAAFMRDIKKRNFYGPPLTDSDMISLGLKPRDGTPMAQVTVETYLVGRHELGMKIVYATGSPDDRANKGYRIWYSVAAQREAMPANPDDLRKSFLPNGKRMSSDSATAAKPCYMAVQVENDGKKGLWGTLTGALIP
jgi:hypothetical protein